MACFQVNTRFQESLTLFNLARYWKPVAFIESQNSSRSLVSMRFTNHKRKRDCQRRPNPKTVQATEFQGKHLTISPSPQTMLPTIIQLFPFNSRIVFHSPYHECILFFLFLSSGDIIYYWAKEEVASQKWWPGDPNGVDWHNGRFCTSSWCLTVALWGARGFERSLLTDSCCTRELHGLCVQGTDLPVW